MDLLQVLCLLVTLLGSLPLHAQNNVDTYEFASTVFLATQSDDNAPKLDAVWFPGGADYDLLRVSLWADAPQAFRGTLRIELNLSPQTWREPERMFIERAILAEKDATKTYDILLPADALFIDAKLFHADQSFVDEPVGLIDPPNDTPHRSPGHSHNAQESWLSIGSHSHFGEITCSPNDEKMSSLPTSSLYLADCAGLLALDQIEYSAAQVQALRDAVAAGATLFTLAPSRAFSNQQLLNTFFEEGLSPETFSKERILFSKCALTNQASLRRYQNKTFAFPDLSERPEETKTDFDRLDVGPLSIETSGSSLNQGAPPFTTYNVGLGKVVLVERGEINTLGHKILNGVYQEQHDLIPLAFSEDSFRKLIDVSQQYVFSPMSVMLMLILYVALAGPFLFFFLRKRAPALLVPAGATLSILAISILLVATNLRRAGAPKQVEINLTSFASDGTPQRVQSFVGIHAENDLAPLLPSWSLRTLSNRERLSPLRVTLNDAALTLAENGLSGWQAALFELRGQATTTNTTKAQLTYSKEGGFHYEGNKPLAFALVKLSDRQLAGNYTLRDLKPGISSEGSRVVLEDSALFDHLDERERELFLQLHRTGALYQNDAAHYAEFALAYFGESDTEEASIDEGHQQHEIAVIPILRELSPEREARESRE